MTPAEEIRAAADKLRALATAASTDTDGTPTAHWTAKSKGHDHSRLYGDHLTRDDGQTIAWPPLVRGGSMHRPPHMHPQHAAYAATMGPTVGLALADWLDSWGVIDLREHAAMQEDARHALALARAINGGQQ